MQGVGCKSIILLIITNIITFIFSSMIFKPKTKLNNNKTNIYKDLYLNLMETVVRIEVYSDSRSLTMIAQDRLKNVGDLIEIIIKNNIKGDVVECGTWRGGAMAFARAVLNVYNETNRVVHLFDTFTGFLCLPNSKYVYEREWCKDKEMNDNSLERVKNAFNKLKLLDGVKFYQGFFNVTIKDNMFNKIALLRLDADSYDNTMFLLEKLYNKVEDNGYVIIDDYKDWPSCRQAVTDYRNNNKILSPILTVPTGAVYWKKK